MSRALFENLSRILAEWRFNSVNAAETGSGYEDESFEPDGTASDVTDGGANAVISIETTTPAYDSTVLRIAAVSTISATAADAVTNNVYFQFTYTPNANRRALLEKLTFRVARGGASTPRGWALRSSLDNYASNIATADVSTQRPTWTNVQVDLAAYQSYAGPITFRIYQYAPAVGSSLEFDNIQLHGFAEQTALIYAPVGTPTNSLTIAPGTMLERSGATLAPGGVLGDFTVMAWFRRNAVTDPYTTFFSFQKSSNPGESTSYFWIGQDMSLSATRGLSVYGPGGAHSTDLMPADGNFVHIAVTKTGERVRGYVNGNLVNWDVGGLPYFDCGGTSFDEIDTIYCGAEDGFGPIPTGVELDVAYFAATTEVMSQAEIQAAMMSTTPVVADGFSYPLQSNLTDALGGENVVWNPSGSSVFVDGPSLTAPVSLTADAAALDADGDSATPKVGNAALRVGEITDATTSTRFTPGTRLRYTTSAPTQPGVVALWVSFPSAPTADTTIFAWNVNDSGAAYRMSVGVQMDAGVPKFCTDSTSVGGLSSVVVRPGVWYKLVVRMPNADGTGLTFWIDENYVHGAENAAQGPFGVPGGSFVSLTINGNEAAGEQGTFDIAQFRIYSQDYAPDVPEQNASLQFDLAQNEALLPTWVDYRLGGTAPGEYTDRSGNGRDFSLSGTLQAGQTGPAWMYANQTMGVDASADHGVVGTGELYQGANDPAFANGSVRFSGDQYISRAISGVTTDATWVAHVRLTGEPTTDFTNVITLWENNNYSGTFLQVYLGDGSGAGQPGRRELAFDCSGLSGGSFLESGIQLRARTTYRIAVVLDSVSDEVRLYLDDVLALTKTGVTGAFSASNMSIRIGSDGSGAHASLDVARFRLWSRVLSLSEISSEYGFERAQNSDASLIGDWPLSSTSDLDDAAHASNAFTNSSATNGGSFAGGSRAAQLEAEGDTGAVITGSSSLAADAATLAADGEVNHDAAVSLAADPAALSATGDIEHTGSSALAADTATVSSSGEIEHTGTSSLVADAAILAADGELNHTGTSSLVADTATLAADGEVNHDAAVSLAADAATLSATGEVEHSGSAALAADTATLTSDGEVNHVGTSSLTASTAELSAQGAIEHAGTSALEADDATIAADGEVNHAAAASLQADIAALSADGEINHAGTASLVADSAELDASGSSMGSGDSQLVADPATLSASGDIDHTGSSALLADSATLESSGEINHAGTSTLASGAATLAADGDVVHDADVSLQASAATLAADGEVNHSGSGSLVADTATASAAGEVNHSGSGSLIADNAALAADGEVNHDAAVSLQADIATIAAAGEIIHTGSVTFVASEAELDAAGTVVRPSFGELFAGDAVMTADGYIVHVGSGELDCDTAAMSCAGEIVHAGSGDLDADIATFAAYGDVVHDAEVSLAAAPAVLVSSGEINHDGISALVSDPAVLAALGVINHDGVSSLVASPVQLTAAGDILHVGTSDLVAGAASLGSAGEIEHDGISDLFADAAYLSAIGQLDRAGTATFDADPAELLADGIIGHNAIGDLEASSATLEAYEADVNILVRDIPTVNVVVSPFSVTRLGKYRKPDIYVAAVKRNGQRAWRSLSNVEATGLVSKDANVDHIDLGDIP